MRPHCRRKPDALLWRFSLRGRKVPADRDGNPGDSRDAGPKRVKILSPILSRGGVGDPSGRPMGRVLNRGDSMVTHKIKGLRRYH